MKNKNIKIYIVKQMFAIYMRVALLKTLKNCMTLTLLVLKKSIPIFQVARRKFF